MKRYYYPNTQVILRKTLKKGLIVKKLDGQRMLVSYYDNNKLKYEVITELDIIDDDEYLKIRNRINTINKIID